MKKTKEQNKEIVLSEINKGTNQKIRLSLSLFNDQYLFHARVWMLNKESNSFEPTPKGLTFSSAETFTNFLRSLLAEERKILRALNSN